MKVARSPASFVSGTGERNTHLFPCVVIFCAVPDTTICAVCDCAAICDAARLAGLLMLPIMSDNIIAGGQTLGDIDCFFRFASVVCVDRLDLFAANAAGGIFFLDGKINGFFFCGPGRGGVASKWSEYSDFDRVGRCADGRDPIINAEARSPARKSVPFSPVMFVLPSWVQHTQSKDAGARRSSPVGSLPILLAEIARPNFGILQKIGSRCR